MDTNPEHFLSLKRARIFIHSFFGQLLQGYCPRHLLCSPGGDSFSPDSCCSLFRNKESPDIRGARPHTCIGTEKKKQEQRESLTRCHQWKGKGEQQQEEEEEDEDEDSSSMPFIDESDEKEDEEDIPSPHSPKRSDKKADASGLSTSSVAISLTSSFSAAPPPLPPTGIAPPRKPSEKDLFGSCALSPDQPRPASRSPRASPGAQGHPPSPADRDREVKALRRISDERPKLDKSYSSPTYDLDDREAVAFLGR